MEMKFCVEQKRKKVEKTMLAIYVHGSKLLLFLFYFITRWSWPLYLCFETHIMWYSTWQGWILYVCNDLSHIDQISFQSSNWESNDAPIDINFVAITLKINVIV
jgi:hypothetical protein